uniref:uncharacterized protein LOC120325751 isoform X1 n=1 Tax=Styela clava TaxID=7725 RepID=UPI0019395897|nr:uncharacterized protein LOC120325751 isoform X1 [Styela clava]
MMRLMPRCIFYGLFIFGVFHLCSSDQCESRFRADRTGVIKGPTNKKECRGFSRCKWTFDYPSGAGALTLSFTSLNDPTPQARLEVAKANGQTIKLIKFQAHGNTVCFATSKSEHCSQEIKRNRCETYTGVEKSPYVVYKCDPSALQFQILYEFWNCTEETTTPAQTTPKMTDTISEVQMTSSIEAETRGYPTFDFSEYKREDTSIAEETSYYKTSMVADIEQRARSNVSPLNKEISSTVAVSLVVLLLNVSTFFS